MPRTPKSSPENAPMIDAEELARSMQDSLTGGSPISKEITTQNREKGPDDEVGETTSREHDSDTEGARTKKKGILRKDLRGKEEGEERGRKKTTKKPKSGKEAVPTEKESAHKVEEEQKQEKTVDIAEIKNAIAHSETIDDIIEIIRPLHHVTLQFPGQRNRLQHNIDISIPEAIERLEAIRDEKLSTIAAPKGLGIHENVLRILNKEGKGSVEKDSIEILREKLNRQTKNQDREPRESYKEVTTPAPSMPKEKILGQKLPDTPLSVSAVEQQIETLRGELEKGPHKKSSYRIRDWRSVDSLGNAKNPTEEIKGENEESFVLDRENKIRDLEKVRARLIQEEQERKEMIFRDAESFNDVLDIIKTVPGIQGKTEFFSQDELLGRLYLVKAGKLSSDYLTRSRGLRAKVQELLGIKENTETLPQEPPKETVAEAEEGEHKETADKQDVPVHAEEVTHTEEQETAQGEKPRFSKPQEEIETIRSKAHSMFLEATREANKTLHDARGAYMWEIKKDARAQQEQGRLKRLMTSLKMTLTKKEPEKSPSYQKTKDVYEAAVKGLAFSLGTINPSQHFDTIDQETLAIIQEEKDNVEKELIRELLVMEKNALLDAKADAFNEKDKKLASQFIGRYAQQRRKTGSSIIGRFLKGKDTSSYDY